MEGPFGFSINIVLYPDSLPMGVLCLRRYFVLGVTPRNKSLISLELL